MSQRRQTALIAAGAILGIQALLVGVYWLVEPRRSPARPPSFRVERLSGRAVAPDLLLERSDGRRFSLHEQIRGIRLVHFWATWCPPCLEELPGLLAASRHLADRGLTLIAVSVDDDWKAVRQFFGGVVPPAVYRAVAAEAHKAYDVFALPDTYLISGDGRLRFRYGGARNWRTAAARDHLETQLRGSRRIRDNGHDHGY